MRFSLFILLSIPFCLQAQDYKYAYSLDKNFATCPHDQAVFYGKGFIDSGLVQLDCTNKITGNLFMSAHFIDSSLSMLQGHFQSFYSNGKTENNGYYNGGYKNGVWEKWDDKGLLLDSSVYQNDKKIVSTYFGYINNVLSVFKITDSIHDTYKQINYDSTGKVLSSVSFNGQKGVFTRYYNGGVKTDSVFGREVIQASYNGSQNDYSQYIARNIDIYAITKNGAPLGSYKVMVKFTVNEDGSISDVKAMTNYGFGMEDQAVSIIKRCPKWKPATEYGLPVKAYRIQPLIFVIDGNY